MENQDTKEVDQEATQATYSIITYPGSSVPEAYTNLIYSKWLRSLRYGNDYFKLIDSEAYYDVYHKYIESILAKTNTQVKLAVLTDDKDVVLGWSVSRDKTLDYVHIHKDHRRQGIATSLVSPQTEV